MNSTPKIILITPKLGIAILALCFTGCGGTFTLRPDMSISYTTPQILKAPIIAEK